MKEKLYVNIQIMINRSLYNKGIIDNETYSTINEKLLKKIEKGHTL